MSCPQSLRAVPYIRVTSEGSTTHTRNKCVSQWRYWLVVSRDSMPLDKAGRTEQRASQHFPRWPHAWKSLADDFNGKFLFPRSGWSPELCSWKADSESMSWMPLPLLPYLSHLREIRKPPCVRDRCCDVCWNTVVLYLRLQGSPCLLTWWHHQRISWDCTQQRCGYSVSQCCFASRHL